MHFIHELHISNLTVPLYNIFLLQSLFTGSHETDNLDKTEGMGTKPLKFE